jgi:hypothetical protein
LGNKPQFLQKLSTTLGLAGMSASALASSSVGVEYPFAVLKPTAEILGPTDVNSCTDSAFTLTLEMPVASSGGLPVHVVWSSDDAALDFALQQQQQSASGLSSSGSGRGSESGHTTVTVSGSSVAHLAGSTVTVLATGRNQWGSKVNVTHILSVSYGVIPVASILNVADSRAIAASALSASGPAVRHVPAGKSTILTAVIALACNVKQEVEYVFIFRFI